MDEPIFVSPDSYEIIDAPEYFQSVTECFGDVPDVARSLIGNAKRMFKKIEKMLYTAPAFVNAVKAIVPEEAYQVILTNEQKEKIASGALKLMKYVTPWSLPRYLLENSMEMLCCSQIRLAK